MIKNKLLYENSLERFLVAQEDCYEEVLQELRQGRKETYWIWFIFPQLRGLGNSEYSQYYGFGSEQQINIQNKGKLAIGGLDYAAGFSIENDGDQAGTIFNENVFIDLINASSGTTVSFSRDHIQRSDSDYSATNLVGFTPNELSQTSNKNLPNHSISCNP
jgi:hypothetical protein